MHQTDFAGFHPYGRSLRSAALGGASLIAIAAMGVVPAVAEGASPTLPAVQIAQAPAGGPRPLTDRSVPWNQQRAELARDATKAMTEAIEGFKSVAQHAILTNNPGLLQIARATIQQFGDLSKALKDRAYDTLTSGQNMSPETAKAVRLAAGNGQVGEEAAQHALEEIDKFRKAPTQQSRAPSQPSGSGQQQASNTIVPANQSNSPTICAPGQTCKASLNDYGFVWSVKGSIGDARYKVSDMCRLTNACTPVAGESGRVQFSPVVRVPENLADAVRPRTVTPAAGSRTLAMTSGSYVNPFIPAAPQPTVPVSAQTWDMFNAAYRDYRTSTGQASANAGRQDVSRALTSMFRRTDFIDYGLMTDLSASNVLMTSHMSYLQGLAQRNPPDGRGGLGDYGLSGQRRLATKQVWNEDFTNYAGRESVPTFQPRYETDFDAARTMRFWSGSVLRPTAQANDTLQPRLDWKGANPHLGLSYSYNPTKSAVTNGYVRYDFNGADSTARYFVPATENVTEAAKYKESFGVPTTAVSDTLQINWNEVFRRNLTTDFRVSSVTNMRGASIGYTYNSNRSLRVTQLAEPGKGCESLPYPTEQIANVTFTGRRNFFWEQIVPATQDAGAVCQLGVSRPTVFYSLQQQLVARRIGPSITGAPRSDYSYFDGCNYDYDYDYAPRAKIGTWEALQLLRTQAPAPNDPLAASKGTWRQRYDDQWWLKAINWLKPDGTTVLPNTARPVTVAVIDSGLDLRHPELFGALWVNPEEPVRPSRPGTFRNPMRAQWFGWNFLDDSGDVRDFNGHGTVVAGIIAADVDNRLGIAGVNPWARIMPLKVADHRGRSSNLAAAKAIVYAADHGARVINMSLGHKRLSEVVKRAIDYAARKNVLIVVSAGNDGVDVKDFTPAAYANTIAVAAVDNDLKRAGFSNFGDNITIAAPGTDILSLRAGGTDLMRFVKADYVPGSAVVNDRYYRVDGTSFAAPMVAGVASLILSMRPDLSAGQVKRMILQSARDISGQGRDRNVGYGLLDADAALKADPAFFVESLIAGLSVAQVEGRQAVQVRGTASADRLRGAWIEIGQGESPTEWKKVAENVTRPVENGIIGNIDPRNLAGARIWTVRVVVEHENGRKREARYVLRLG